MTNFQNLKTFETWKKHLQQGVKIGRDPPSFGSPNIYIYIYRIYTHHKKNASFHGKKVPSFLKVLFVQHCGRARFSVSCRSLSLWPRSLLAPLGHLWTWKPRTLVFSKMIICDPAIFVAYSQKLLKECQYWSVQLEAESVGWLDAQVWTPSFLFLILFGMHRKYAGYTTD